MLINGKADMSIELPLNDMSVAEKVRLLEMIWDNLCSKHGDPQSPEWHREVLQERKRRLESGETTVSPWDDVKTRLLKLGQ